MHLVVTPTASSYQVAVELSNLGIIPVTLGKFRSYGTSGMMHVDVDFNDAPTLLSGIRHLLETIRGIPTKVILPEDQDLIESVIVLPPAPTKVDSVILDYYSLIEEFGKILAGPMMLYRYLKMFDMLSTECRMLFVQSVALQTPTTVPAYVGNQALPGAVKSMVQEFAVSRPKDTFSIFAAPENPEAPLVASAIQRFLVAPYPQEIYNSQVWE